MAGTKTCCCSCGTGFWALGADPGLCFSGFQTVRGWRDAVRSPVRMTLLQPKSSRSQMDLMSKASSLRGLSWSFNACPGAMPSLRAGRGEAHPPACPTTQSNGTGFDCLMTVFVDPPNYLAVQNREVHVSDAPAGMQLLIARLTARLRRCQGSQCLWSLFPRVGHHRGRQGAPRTAPETCGQPSGQERAHERARHLPVLCHFFVSVNCPRGGQPSRYLLCKGAAAVDQTRRQRQLVVVAKLRDLPDTTGRGVGGGNVIGHR